MSCEKMVYLFLNDVVLCKHHLGSTKIEARCGANIMARGASRAYAQQGPA
jgi:hypothetical protein